MRSFDVPVLLLVFGRPALTSGLLDRLRPARPARLFIACDGPRPQIRGDCEKVLETRRVVHEQIDWPCDVQKLYRDRNVGCRAAVSGALRWFFGQVEMGIVLEDDCHPGESFLPFCEELLHRYRNEPRVMHISGDNFLGGACVVPHSYYFTDYAHVWGWASWQRAWRHYDVRMYRDSARAMRRVIAGRVGRPDERERWLRLCLLTKWGVYDTWDHQWCYSVWRSGGVCINPAANLVTNVGFACGGTHTSDPGSALAGIPAARLGALSHPSAVAVDREADEFQSRTLYVGSPPRIARAVGYKVWTKARATIKDPWPMLKASIAASTGRRNPPIDKFG